MLGSHAYCKLALKSSNIPYLSGWAVSIHRTSICQSRDTSGENIDEDLLPPPGPPRGIGIAQMAHATSVRPAHDDNEFSLTLNSKLVIM